MNLQSNDRSHEALTVGSLKVLGDLNNGIISDIHTHLQSTDAQQLKLISDMEKVYKNISADGVISANEKQILKKEISIIETEYPIILQKAKSANKSEQDIKDFKDAFKTLRDYLFVELKIFDEMSEALEVDRNAFNEKFADYYKSRAILQVNRDGLIHYTWIKFAKDANGTDMSDYPDDGRHWMGIAYRPPLKTPFKKD